MAYGDQSGGIGGRALSATAALALHTALGAALVMGTSVVVLKPVREGAVTGIALSPPTNPLDGYDTTSRGVPGHLMEHEPATAPMRERAGSSGPYVSHSFRNDVWLPSDWPPRWIDVRWSPNPPQPISDPATWIAPNELPFHERYDGSDWIAYSLIVDRDGRVSACEIIRRSASARIDEAICRLITLRARFKPAIDDAGAPVESAYNGTVRWEFPD